MKRIVYVLCVVALLGGLAWWLSPASIEPRPKPRIIALIQLTEVDDSTVAGFKDGMAAAGYQEGQDVVYLSQGPAGKIDRLNGIISELLTKNPDLIMVSSTPATQAVKRLTMGKHIPVVFAPVNDPVDAGIVANLRRPGGNITGIRLPTGDDLRLQWLVKIAPKTKRVFVPHTPGDMSAQATLNAIKGAAPILGVELLPQAVAGSEEVDAALARLPANTDAIFLPRDSSVGVHLQTFIAYADAHRLPLCVPGYHQVPEGALLSYGFYQHNIGRQAARLADQILRGTPAGDLPVEMAENLLAINADTAERIGLDIPAEILRQADKVFRTTTRP